MFKTILTSSAIALTLILSPAIVLADTPTTAASNHISPKKLILIEELRVLTKRDENATQILDLMIHQIQDQANTMGKTIFGENTDPAITQTFNDTFNRITTRMYDLMQEQIDFVTIQRNIDQQLYNEYFTEAELQDLIDFYRTPTGQKTAQVLPQLTQRSMELFSQEITPTMLTIQQQVLTEEFGFNINSAENPSGTPLEPSH